jgi:methionyl-tRNA synthetase
MTQESVEQRKCENCGEFGKCCMEAEKQEPVSTIEDLEQEIYQNTRNFVSLDVMEWMLKRYYTHPPQRTWVGLTDEEAQWLYDNCRTPSNLIDMVEAKLKEKNHG